MNRTYYNNGEGPQRFRTLMTDLEYLDSLEIRDYESIVLAFLNGVAVGQGTNIGAAMAAAWEYGQKNGIINKR